MKKRISILALVLALMVTVVACGGGGDEQPPAENEDAAKVDEVEEKDEAKTETLKVAMVTDEGGVNDQSFNESAWAGLTKAQEELDGVESNYSESENESEYPANLETLLDDGNDFIWGIGYKLSQAIDEAAEANPDTKYGIIDYDFEAEENKEQFPDGTRDNVVGVLFNDEQSSFLVGYIAGRMTETNKVGFVGGIGGDVIWRFENGFKAGVQYAAKELGKEITVEDQYADTFTDSSKGKAIATSMYQQDFDVVFHAAGGVGDGVIEAAREQDKWVIGVDMDQNHMAPDNVLTSAMKRVDVAIFNIIEDLKAGKFQGGETLRYGLEDEGVGIAPTSDKNVPAEILKDVDEIEKMIIDGEIEVPYNEETYENWIKELK